MYVSINEQKFLENLRERGRSKNMVVASFFWKSQYIHNFLVNLERSTYFRSGKVRVGFRQKKLTPKKVRVSSPFNLVLNLRLVSTALPSFK